MQIGTSISSPVVTPKTTDPAIFRNVIVGVDGTDTGRDAIALAEMLRDPDGGLTLAHVAVPQSQGYSSFLSPLSGTHVNGLLEQEQSATGVTAELTEMVAPSVGSGLRQLARARGADLLVVGSCSRGSVGRLLHGDDTRGSLTGAPCAVAVAPHGYAGRWVRIGSIGVAYNGTPESEAALATARVLARRDAAALTVLRALTVVWPSSLSTTSRSRWAMEVHRSSGSRPRAAPLARRREWSRHRRPVARSRTQRLRRRS